MSDESASGSDPDLDPDVELEDAEEEEEEEEVAVEEHDRDDEEGLLDEGMEWGRHLRQGLIAQTHPWKVCVALSMPSWGKMGSGRRGALQLPHLSLSLQSSLGTKARS